MAAAADHQHQHQQHGGSVEEKELLSSVVDDIRSYSGSDPLRPWLRGIRRLEGALPPAALREKLPRFLQKCAQEFQDVPRYRDDPRYLRVWIQMMDYVKDAKPLLKKLERNRIGLKRAAFYMAYALYYEKRKRFEDAEKMYRLGIQNLAEPIEELHKSHDQFIHRLELYKNRKAKLQEGMPSKVGSLATCVNQVEGDSRNYTEQKSNTVQKLRSSSNPSLSCYQSLGPAKVGVLSRCPSGDNKILSRYNSDDTVVVRFVGSALDGKSETEDACHHGLVEPTVNMKEAMDTINSMFLEPVEPETMLKRRPKRDQPKFNQQTSAFEIFVDEDQHKCNHPNILHDKNTKSDDPMFTQQTSAFEIFVDEDQPNSNDPTILNDKKTKSDHPKFSQQTSAFEIFVDEDQPDSNDPTILNDKNTKSDHPKFSQQTSAFEIFIDEDDPNGNNQYLGQNRNSNKENRKFNQKTSGLEIFVDENEPKGNYQNVMRHKNTRCPPRPLRDSSKQQGAGDFQKPFVGGFAIWPDDEDEQCEKNDDGVRINSRTVQPTHNKVTLLHSEQADSETRYSEGPHPVISGLREDTVIHRFVGSAVVDEPKVENALHHGLVDPTVNLQEAMDDINNMFEKPLYPKDDKRRNKRANAVAERKAAPIPVFSILADDDLGEKPAVNVKPSNSCKFGSESDLFEPTITTRDVMAEINDMFGASLDY